MKNHIYILATIFIALLSSCNDHSLDKDPSYDQQNNIENTNSEVVSKKNALNFAQQISSSLFNHIKTRSSDSSENESIGSIIPVVENSDTLLWILNYQNNGGYLILSARKNRFPIVAFNNEGTFDLNTPHNKRWIEEQISALLKIPSDGTNDSIHSFADSWNDNVSSGEGETVVTEFEIDTIKPVSTRSIPERANPINRRSVAPLCYSVQWGTGFGYHYEMPKSAYYFHGPCKLPVNELVVSICHLMYHYWIPGKYGWMYMPATIKQIPANDKTNPIASMFKDVSTQLEVEYNLDNGCILKPSFFFNLKTFFAANGYSNTGEIITYNEDESSFLKVYNNLLAQRPVLFATIFQPNGAKRNWVIDDSRDRIEETWVVDGYQEIRVKVTKKKYFLGIKVKEKVHYYYGDFFRFLYPEKGTYSDYLEIKGDRGTGWFQQDHNLFNASSNPKRRKYAIINIQP